MAGVPAHSLDQYLARLIRIGEATAIAEQVGEVGVEKGPVRREVVRLVTPGTATEDSLLEPRRQNLLAAACSDGHRFGLSWIELSSGRFTVLETSRETDWRAELARLTATELLLPEGTPLADLGGLLRERPPWHFDSKSGRRLLLEQFGTQDLRGFGAEELSCALGAAGALLQYVRETQKALVPHVRSLRTETVEEALILDATTRRNLEIEQSTSGDAGVSLADILDVCATGMGSRQLRRWLQRPLRSADLVTARHHAVAQLLESGSCRGLRKQLQSIADIERISARLALRSARPRDLRGLSDSLSALPELATLMQDLDRPLLRRAADRFAGWDPLAGRLVSALAEELPVSVKDGGVFRAGFDPLLDELRSLADNADRFLSDLEQRERTRSGIESLRVGYNRVHGYYIEVSKAQSGRVPVDFTRRQTLTNAERYITEELKRFEDQVLSARERALAREKVLYESFLDELGEHLPALQALAEALSELDALAAFADRAEDLNWVAPEFVPEAGIEIREGRHPIVERTLQTPFVPNDTCLGAQRRLLVITGPNMGGKSTYMRQTALIVLLAYTGSFVPAGSARLGPVDRIFTRIGASDDLSRAQSTFMVEMSETANILHNATPCSLVLMDEIGRGTSTYDGLSLARACAETLARDVGAFTLFATHYFELTDLAGQIPTVVNVHVDAAEYADKLIFLHQIQPGAANRSYGLQVAALAGVPSQVVTRAKQILSGLEQHRAQTAATDPQQPELPLFSPAPPSALLEALSRLEPDRLTPREALDRLYELKRLADGGS
jgi:DNA mismatch repair protein MutS